MTKKLYNNCDALNNVYLLSPGSAAKKAAELPTAPEGRVVYAILGVGRPEQAEQVAKATAILTRKGYLVLLQIRLWADQKQFNTCARRSYSGTRKVAAVLCNQLKDVDHFLRGGASVAGLILGSDIAVAPPENDLSPEEVVERVYTSAVPRMPSLGNPEGARLVIWLPELKIQQAYAFRRSRAHLFYHAVDSNPTNVKVLFELDKISRDMDDYVPALLVVLSTNLGTPQEVLANAVGWFALALVDIVIPFNNLSRKLQTGGAALTEKHQRLLSDVLEPMVLKEEVCVGEPNFFCLNLLAYDSEDAEEMFLLLLNPLDGNATLTDEEGLFPPSELSLDLLDLEGFGVEASSIPDISVVRKSHANIKISEDKRLVLPPGGFCVLRLFAQSIRPL